MLLKSKEMAFLGMLLAITVLLIVLAGIIETNTLFFLVAASYAVGIAIKKAHFKMGLAFYIAACLLSFFIAPNKIYVVTFAFLGLYMLLSEGAFEVVAQSQTIKNRFHALWLAKIIIFNSLYLPCIFFFPQLIISQSIAQLPSWWLLLAIAVGQVFLVIYDYAYRYIHRWQV
jgi:hypothetical protein